MVANTIATFHCNATAKPIATFGWLKDGSLFNSIVRPLVIITYSTDGSNCSDSDPPQQCVSSSTVVMLDAVSNDVGNYTCVATNEYGNNSKSFDLVVKGT